MQHMNTQLMGSGRQPAAPAVEPARARVRRLRGLGAVALKRTAYLLPDTPDHYEHFRCLSQEIQREGGEATLLRIEQLENVSAAEVVRLFARSEAYGLRLVHRGTADPRSDDQCPGDGLVAWPYAGG